MIGRNFRIEITVVPLSDTRTSPTEGDPRTPAHYQMDPEPVDVITQWGLSFNAGNALKYLARYRRKGDPVGDLNKAIHYLTLERDHYDSE